MHKTNALPKDKKLTVLCRIEPGCLGPDGLEHIADFCRFANQQLKQVNSCFIIWQPLPRYDKSLPEMQYSVNNKQLTYAMAGQYLRHFMSDMDDFEEHFHDHISVLIDEFLANIKR